MSIFGFDRKMPIPEEGCEGSYVATLLQSEIERMSRQIAQAMDTQARELLVAHLLARGYVVVAPEQMRHPVSHEASLAFELKVRDAKIAELESMVAHLSKGGSVTP